MRNKKMFSFNEEQDAENIIKNGFPNGIDYIGMYVVAKYFRKMLGYGAIRLERELIYFCIKQDSNFNPVIEADIIRKWVNSAMNYGLRKIESVLITQKEIDFLKTIELNKDRKILFITLILSKAIHNASTRKKSSKGHSENYYIRNNNFLDIIKLSGVRNMTEINLADLFHKYPALFTVYYPEKQLIKINYADNTANGLIIDKLDKLLDYYELFFGETIAKNSHRKFNCERCGRELEKANNSQKYCKECSKIIKNTRQKELMRKRRSL
jgi:hypothetical protein